MCSVPGAALVCEPFYQACLIVAVPYAAGID